MSSRKTRPLLEAYAADILDSLADGVFTVDLDFRIQSFNSAAERITGISRKEAVGQNCRDVFHSNICDAHCALKRSIQKNEAVTGSPVYFINAYGERVPISISAAPLKDGAGNLVGGVESFRDLTEIEHLRKQLKDSDSFEKMIGKSAVMQNMFRILPDIAMSDSTVLIFGRTGTGKELLARAIHHLSHRSDGPFVAVNCGAIPETLVESELFGYKKGAFTGAVSDKIGKFVQAHEGTFFLDEIGELPPVLQVKLLRVLEDGLVEPLGGTSGRSVNIRLVSATNQDLLSMVNSGRFREDLYFRLNVVPLRLPELKERREDIPLLTDHFIATFRALKGREVSGISPSALDILLRYDFPGNIRELENIIEYAFVLCHGGLIQPEHLPHHLHPEENEAEGDTTEHPKKSAGGLEDARRLAIVTALKKTRGKITQAARELGIDRGTLRRHLKRLNIDAQMYKD